MIKLSGVYKLTNIITGDCYIGSSKNIKLRWTNHKCPSTWAQYPNSRMYHDMAQYGLDNFKFEIIEETTPEERKSREQYYIETLNPSYNSNNANGRDLEKYKERCKEWYKAHREEHLYRTKKYNNAHREEMLIKYKEWCKVHREEILGGLKRRNDQLCLYRDEILTINALSHRFHRQGIPHAWLEAKKYLIEMRGE